MRDSDGRDEERAKTKNVSYCIVDIFQVSMDANRDLNFALGWNRINLGIVGIWPDPLESKRQNMFSRFRFLVACFFLLAFLCIPQSINLILIWGDVNLMAENLSTINMLTAYAIIKAIVLWRQRKVLKVLVGFFYEDWNALKTQQEKARMLKYAKVTRRISIGCTSVTVTLAVFYITLRITMINIFPDNEPFHPFIYKAYFPYDTTGNSIYVLTNIGQILTTCSGIFTYTGSDGFISMLVLHICSQFENLREKLQSLVNDQIKGKTIQEFKNKLAQIVKRHEHLNWFAKTIQKTFNMTILAQLLSSTIQLCLQGFCLIMILIDTQSDLPVMQIIFLIIFITFVIIHLYVYCYIGEMLLVQSTQIGVSAYESKWYNIPSKEAKDLLFIMYRTTVPLCLTAGDFTIFSMQTFSKILRASIAYLSVLLTVTGQK